MALLPMTSFAKDETKSLGDIRFLVKLQSAMQADDRQAIADMVRLPLRVNGPSAKQVKIYRSRRSILRDFDHIFSEPIRRAILAQRADMLFRRYDGAMIGNGEIWFDAPCLDVACRNAGAPEIFAVNRQ
jgi:hypothetical protein